MPDALKTHRVISVEWSGNIHGEPETIIRVSGTIQPVGAGDAITYHRAGTTQDCRFDRSMDEALNMGDGSYRP